MDISLKGHFHQAVAYLFPFQFQHAAGFFAQDILRQESVSLAGKVVQRILDSALDPMFIISRDSHLFRDFIRFLKTHAKEVLCQTVGIFLNRGDGVRSVNPVQLHRVIRVYSELLQIQRNLREFPVAAKRFRHRLRLFFPDSRNFRQPVRLVLDDREGLTSKPGDNGGSRLFSNSFQHAGRKKLFDSFFRGRHHLFKTADGKLLAVSRMNLPLSAEQIAPSFMTGGQVSHRRKLLIFSFKYRDGISVFLIVKNNIRDDALFFLFHFPTLPGLYNLRLSRVHTRSLNSPGSVLSRASCISYILASIISR